MNNIIKINKSNTTETAQKAVGILKQGGVIIFPTETVYGIGVDAGNQDAIDRIYKIKNRPKDKPLALHIGC